MQAIADIASPDAVAVSRVDAHRAAIDYVARQIDPAFAVVSGVRLQRSSHGRERWQFVIRCEHGPLDAIEVDAQTGEVILLAEDKIRVIREKAAIYAARKAGGLPVDAHGYVLGEYARRRAEQYLGDQIGMFFNAADPVFVPGNPPRWQVTVVFKRYHRGPFTLGVMDVDAHTDEPIPLSKLQRKRIRERTHAEVLSGSADLCRCRRSTTDSSVSRTVWWPAPRWCSTILVFRFPIPG
jgi:hypothetical protein